MKKIISIKRLLSLLTMLVMLATCIPLNASAMVCDQSSYFLGHFVFSDENMGSYHTIKARRARVCVSFKSMNDDVSAGLRIVCYEYGGRKMVEHFLYPNDSSMDENGFCFKISEWFDVNYGVDYRIFYDVLPNWNDADQYPVHVYTWIELQF